MPAIKISGHTNGLPAKARDALTRLYRRKIPANEIITVPLMKELGELSREVSRQIALLIDRRGTIIEIVVGDHSRIVLPDLKRFRVGPSRLRGLRYIHTHLKGEALSDEDLSDMLLLRFDLVAAIQLGENGQAVNLAWAHLSPHDSSVVQYEQPITRPLPDFSEMIAVLEEELDLKGRSKPLPAAGSKGERAYIVHVADRRDPFADEIIAEMRLLARSSGVSVVDIITQFRNQLDPRTVLGKGKLTEITVRAVSQGVSMLLFSSNLTPTQVNRLGEISDLKIVDRTQLILDIFARRAVSSDGKLQVELAQLNYMLPRLVGKHHAMSRLMGGLGGRGPGENKLEMDRRRARERIHKLTRQLKQLSEMRSRKRALRSRRHVPLVVLVGYTNAGKSTLFNQLCGSDVYTEDAAFATLDPTSRKLRLPSGREIILMDTVGFIRDLPRDLIAAFRATLEEIREASLILHVMDLSHIDLIFQMESIEKLMTEIGCDQIPSLSLLNKMDAVPGLTANLMAKKLRALPISALARESLSELLPAIEAKLPQEDSTNSYEVAPYRNN